MARSLAKISTYGVQDSEPSDSHGDEPSDSACSEPGGHAATEPSTSPPSVVYVLDSLLRVTYVSPNVFELLGIQANHFLNKNRSIWEERTLREDAALLTDKLHGVASSGSASIIHRVIDDSGLPLWVAHSFGRVQIGASEEIHGCLIPLRSEKRVQDLDPSIISRFIHKLGNQFQLLNLVTNSLRKSLPETRETEVLEETVEKAIELTRMFSDYSQIPTWLSEVDFFEVLNAAVVTRKSSFNQRGVELDERIDESVNGITVRGDPFLLELAIGSVLQNALEATEAGGKVILTAKVEACDDLPPSVARISIIDTGCGIREEDLGKVTAPFFTSKTHHDGLGLTMAVRFIEMHGGILRIHRLEDTGTEVSIAIPTNVERRLTDR